MKRLLSGNEAIALGAWEGGVRFAAAYPGTPSTEILENLAGYSGVLAEWAGNEKVALDSAIGAAFAGVRALATMKHVGVNVAADSLMSVSYTGVRGGLVVVAADDPGMFSSQNEQDTRQYARLAKMPCLDPSDSQEARDFTALAFELSERFDTPVMVRSSTRISHSKSAVEVRPPAERPAPSPLPPFERAPEKFVTLPAHARRRHPIIEERLVKLAEYAESAPFNRVIEGDRSIGVISGGIAYQHAREVFPGASFLKLGMSYPLPKKLIRDFAASVDKLLVIEEGDPFWEEQLKAMGLEVIGKNFFPLVGEVSAETLRVGAEKAGLPLPLSEEEMPPLPTLEVPPRPPALCPGCPHRAAFYAANKQKLVVMGDIGCYSIGTLPPFSSTDAIISMGASISLAHGMNRAGLPDKVVAVIGDSTFFHAGLSALASMVYNQGNSTVLILDNQTTGMTGAQGNPSTGVTLQGAVGQEIDIEAVVRALGVSDVRVVNALDVKAVDEAIKNAISATDHPSVVVVQGNCVFNKAFQRKPVVEVDLETCNGCSLCFRVGCPAILKSAELDAKTNRPKAGIDPLLCVGCDVCLQVCPRKAIYRPEREEV